MGGMSFGNDAVAESVVGLACSDLINANCSFGAACCMLDDWTLYHHVVARSKICEVPHEGVRHAVRSRLNQHNRSRSP